MTWKMLTKLIVVLTLNSVYNLKTFFSLRQRFLQWLVLLVLTDEVISNSHKLLMKFIKNIVNYNEDRNYWNFERKKEMQLSIIFLWICFDVWEKNVKKLLFEESFFWLKDKINLIKLKDLILSRKEGQKYIYLIEKRKSINKSFWRLLKMKRIFCKNKITLKTIIEFLLFVFLKQISISRCNHDFNLNKIIFISYLILDYFI